MTTSHAPGRACAARTVGPVARHFLDSRAEGRVIAAFRSVFYIGSGAQMICIGTGAVEDGPLTLVTSAPATLDWRDLGVRPGQRAAISAAGIRVEACLRVSTDEAVEWLPAPIAAVPGPAAVASGLAALRNAVSESLPDDGLGRFILPGYRPESLHRDCRAAETPVAEARRWLGDVFSRTGASLAWVDGLIGLGPGLTPSGDDFLGGLMIALHRLGHGAAARLLWGRVRHSADAANPISLALLQAASQGLGSASLHRAQEAILLGDVAAVREAIPGIARIGHSSGWDAMAGIVTALDCWHAAAPEPLPQG